MFIPDPSTHFKLLEKMKAYIALTVVFALLVGTEVKPAAGGVTDAEKEEIVNKHNALRRGVQPTARNMLKMMWNEEAAANAQRHADKCVTKRSTGEERIISTGGCGENMFLSSNELSWTVATQHWYNEVKNFEHGEGSVNGKQVVSYNSNQVGCAMTHCPDADSPYKYYYVCQYCPAGNVGGMGEPYKLGPSCGDCPEACDDKLCTNPCPHKDQFSNCPSMTKMWGCSREPIAAWCQASCKCTTEII